MTATNQNSIHEEIKSRLNSGNTCYHSVQNHSVFHLISKDAEIKMHKTVIIPVILYGCITWPLTLMKEHSEADLRTGC